MSMKCPALRSLLRLVLPTLILAFQITTLLITKMATLVMAAATLEQTLHAPHKATLLLVLSKFWGIPQRVAVLVMQ